LTWFRHFIAKWKNVLTEEEQERLFADVRRALEMEFLNSKQATADRQQAEAVALLIEKLQTMPYAKIQIGSILISKTTSVSGVPKLAVRTLTQSELAKLDDSSRTLSNVDAGQPSPSEEIPSTKRKRIASHQERLPFSRGRAASVSAIPLSGSRLGQLLTDEDRERMRRAHFNGIQICCPADGAILEVRERNLHGSTKTGFLVRCKLCGYTDQF